MKKDFVNPIDEDKITDKPSTLEYAHHVGSAKIEKVDKKKVRIKALSAMFEQTDQQLNQIKEQIELLAVQAKAIEKRKEVSEMIYSAEIGFQPEINHIYHLYRKEDNENILSLIGPNEWGRSKSFPEFVASVRLMADHTWEVQEKQEF